MGIAGQAAARLGQRQAALEAAGEAAMAGVQRAFEAEGPNWKPLAPRTIKERQLLGFGPGPILQRTRAYRRSWQATVRGGTMTIGTSDPRADRLNPVRPVRLSARDQDAVAAAITRVLTGGG